MSDSRYPPPFLPINVCGNHEERVPWHLKGNKTGEFLDSGMISLIQDSVSNDRYPHRCGSCGAKAYIGGNNNVECSNSACKHWDKKDDFDFGGFYKNSPQPDAKDPVGNPFYQTPNPGADTADDSAWSPADCPCAPPFCDKCKKVFGTTP